MILTDKAKETFIDYLRNNKKASIEIGVLRLHWQEYPKEYLNALIIEWFDSVGIYIQIDLENIDSVFSSYIFYSKNKIISIEENSNTRQEATTKAIEKANEIFNNI